MMASVAAPRCLYLVHVTLAEGAPAADFDRWYDDVHVPALLGVPGFRSATRYRRLDAPRRYLAEYEIDGLEVFDRPEYREATGWGPWEESIEAFRAAVYVLDEVRGGEGR
jgi:hypothetical protein